jgi:2-phosphosulfolactate phosphatase
MPPSIEVLLAPAEFAALPGRDLSQTVCVVFDVLRATSSIVTALANGAEAVIPVSEIPEALAIRKQHPEVLLAGEREGRRICAELTGGTEFDLGNSPREFTTGRVKGRKIVLSTTNGSRALRACAGAREVLAGSLLNLRATADYLTVSRPPALLLICAGTFDQAAYEDILAAGALADILWPLMGCAAISDSTRVAREVFAGHRSNLASAIESSRNGRRLMADSELRDDVTWCQRLDAFPIVVALRGDGLVRLKS